MGDHNHHRGMIAPKIAALDAVWLGNYDAEGLIMNRSVSSASSTARPRTRSATLRLLEAEMPTLLLYALTAIVSIYLSQMS